jgi:phosphoribosylformylglycinamidine cyclo-ligase
MKYKDSGVDIDKAGKALKSAGASIKDTWGARVLSDVGAFGGLFDGAGLAKDPVLVSSIDGVGTKLKVAFASGRHDTVGQCLVNHCVNDILVQGAKPLFFLDYFATGGLEDGVLENVIGGMSKACGENGCALIAGETAEMPGLYSKGEYDLAGCIVGVVERDGVIDGSTCQPGDRLMGFASSGLHTNGYSLARMALLDEGPYEVDSRPDELGGVSVGEALLAVHRSYLKQFQAMVAAGIKVKGMAHLTGGGFTDNIPRVLPDGCGVRVQRGTWQVPHIFRLIQKLGGVDEDEMHRAFNMGVGYIFIVAPEDANRVAELGLEHYIGEIGQVARGEGVAYE